MIDRKIAKFKLRRGSDAERGAVTFDEGELIYTTDAKCVYVGDGSTKGGIIIGGYTLNNQPSGADNITIGTTIQNKYTLKNKSISAIHFSTNNTVLTSKGLSVFDAGIGINYDSTTLQVDNGKLKVNPSGTYTVNPTGGLINTVLGVSANTDNTTIKVTSNVIKVGIISAAQIAEGSISRNQLDFSGNDTCTNAVSGLTGTKADGLYIKVDNKQLGFSGGNLMLSTRMLSSINNSSTLSGWQRMPGNFMMQWGKYTNASKNTAYTIIFPQPFVTCYNIQLTPYKNSSTTNLQISAAHTATAAISTMEITKFSFFIDSTYPSNATEDYKLDVMWYAVGAVAALT
jgi:hypothetical protein